MSTRTINVLVNNEYIKGGSVPVGAAGSHNDVVLELAFSALWDGLTKKITWLDATGANPTLTILTVDMLKPGETTVYLVPIPAEPKAYAGDMTMTVKGAEVSGEVETRATLSTSCTFRVLPSAYDSDADEAGDVTPTQAEQLQAEIDGLIGSIGTAAESAAAAASSMEAAEAAQGAAETAQTNAEGEADAAARSATDAAASEENAGNSATDSQSWAVGGTGTRSGEDTNNAKYWSEQAAAGQVNSDWLADSGKAQILNKPSEFPPVSHNHDERYYTEEEMDTALAGKAASSHDHSAQDITSGILALARGGTGVSSLAELASALGCAKIASGSYVGTGTSGVGNENSLTFGFEPKLVLIRKNEGYSSNDDYMFFTWLVGVAQISVCPSYKNAFCYTTLSGNTLSWYGYYPNGHRYAQMNVSGQTYEYVAIG